MFDSLTLHDQDFSPGRSSRFYLHPWEIDPEQSRIRAGWLSTFRHYTNLRRCEARLRHLLRDFRFAPARDVLEDLAIPAMISHPAFVTA